MAGLWWSQIGLDLLIGVAEAHGVSKEVAAAQHQSSKAAAASTLGTTQVMWSENECGCTRPLLTPVLSVQAMEPCQRVACTSIAFMV